MEVVTFSHLDRADPMQAETYLFMKLRSFFIMLKSDLQKPKPQEIIEEAEKILKAHKIVEQKFPFIAKNFKHQITMVKEEMEKAAKLIGGGANE